MSLAEVRYPLPVGSSYSNLAAGNLDGDLTNGLEVVAASNNGTISAFSANGGLLWRVSTPNAQCGPATNRLHSSPALGDVNADGREDILVGYGGVGISKCDGGLLALNGPDGATIWDFSLRDFAKRERFGTRWHTVFSTPAVQDTDGDGSPEIGFGSFDRNVYLLNADGSVRWYYNAADTIWSSPAFADVDGDGIEELIAATDISGNRRLRPPTRDGGFIYAFRTAARSGKKRIFFRDKSLYHWQSHVEQVPYSSPSIGELIASSPGPEIAIASGCFFPQRSRVKRGNWIKIFSLSSGKLLRTLRTQSCSSGSVAIGDIIGSGRKYLVHLSPGGRPKGDGRSRLMAFDPESGQLLWSVVPKSNGRNISSAGSFQSPIIADVNFDGLQDVVLAHGKSILFFKGTDGTPLPCNGTACPLGELGAGGDVSRATPGIMDIDGDGADELLVNVSGGSSSVVSWRLNGEVFSEHPDALNAPAAEWPAWRGGFQRRGSK